MNIQEAIQLVREHARASVASYRATNEITRGIPERSYRLERKTAKKLLLALGQTPSDHEIESATEWSL